MIKVLEKFVGEWLGEETIHASKWGDGGLAQARVSAHLACDGKILLQDYSAVRDQRLWLQAHAVFNATESGFHLYWFDSFGFVPQGPAEGHWDGEQIVFTRVSPRGQTHHFYRWLDDNTYELKLKTSFDHGNSWVPVMDGIYKRQLK